MGLSASLCFGAGVLLSIVFLHLLPETQANFQYAMDVGYIHETHYPVAEVAVCSGFFLVYLIEEVIHAWVDHHTAVKEVEVRGVYVEKCWVLFIRLLFCRTVTDKFLDNMSSSGTDQCIA